MESIILEGNLQNLDRAILRQAFARMLDVRASTKIEGNNYTLEINMGTKNLKGYLTKKPK